jgi:uncharacterized protein (TIGR02147 family)
MAEDEITMRKPEQKVSVFEYGDYRAYLGELYRARKAVDPRFSFRHLSRLAGFSSPNFVKLVIDGKRNLSPAGALRLASGLRLGVEEAAFFRGLVGLNQAGTAEEKRFHAEQLVASRRYRRARPLGPAQYAYYARWYHVAIRELVDTVGFREDPERVARALVPAISAGEARRALARLRALGLVRRERGRLVQADAILTTGDEVAAAAVGEFHREMLRIAAEAIDRFPAAERDLSALTMSLSAEGASRMKALVRRFRKEVLEIARGDRGQTRVYQLGFQLFPLSVAPAGGRTG